MNTLFISRNSPFVSIGGIERYITNLISYYRTVDGKTYIVLPTHLESHEEHIGNVTIFHESSLNLPRSKPNAQKEIASKAQLFLRRVEEIIKTYEISIICAENFHTDFPPAYNLLLTMIATSYKIPLVLQLHSYAITELQVELINQLDWKQISCVSKSVAGDCFLKGSNIDLLSTHYLGVNTADFKADAMPSYELKKELGLDSDYKIVLTATRIIRGKKNILHEKGLVNLIQAFSKLAPRYAKMRLLIAIGKPPEDLHEEFTIAYDLLLGYIKLHNIEESTILKTYKLDEMAKVYKGSDVFALPSENETFGQVFIESMACGLPVIGTKVGGIPEIITDSYNGFLIPPDDSSVLAQKIEILMNNTEIRSKFIAAGIKTVENEFTTEKQLHNFQRMLETTA